MKIEYFKIVKKIKEHVPVFVNKNYKNKAAEKYDYVKKQIHVTYIKKRKIESLESLIHEFAHFLTIDKIRVNKKEIIIINGGKDFYTVSKRHESIAELITVNVLAQLGFTYKTSGFYLSVFGVEYYQNIFNKYNNIIQEKVSFITQLIRGIK